jgi:uncharacterized damage-inducible protein DinB
MITPEYCRTMASYCAWQNAEMKKAAERIDEEELRLHRGAHFGSILATMNHLLWGDLVWMSRLDGGPRPAGGIAESVAIEPTLAAWGAARFRADGRIAAWASRVRQLDLAGDLRWYSGALGREVVLPVALCVAHMFNHQAHHRGQIHAMMTAAGAEGWVSDLFALPEPV